MVDGAATAMVVLLLALIMVDDATPDEKALLQKKLQTLASKVV